MAEGDETGDRLINAIRENWREQDSTAMELVIRLFRLRDMIWSRSNDEAHRAGLTWGEFEALAALRAGRRPHQMTPTEIAGLMLITSGGLTKILQGLESKGLVRRASNEADGRSCFIELTDAGAVAIDALTAKMTADSKALIGSALSQSDATRVLRGLEKLSRAADRQA
ncbi:MAG: MarR family transcriptional regulator [Bauldia litoralis]